MEKIIKNDELICIILRDEHWNSGLNFLTEDDLPIQVGTWWYEKNKILDNHSHKSYERTTFRTMEMVYVKNGSMKVKLFDQKKIHFKDIIIKKGDLAILAYGGHGYEILEDDTKIIESKNGPFIDVSKDKEKF